MAAADKLIILTRQEFYERIWTTPISALTKELGIKPNSILGLCDDHQVPRPEMGHWAKVRHGKAPTQPPLPSIDIGDQPIKILPDALRSAYWNEKYEEHERAAADRVHRQNVDEERWDRLTTMASDWRRAETIRGFLSALTASVAGNDELTIKTSELTAWAEEQLRELDPMSYDPNLVFEEMNAPVPPPSTMDILDEMDRSERDWDRL